MNTCKCGHTFTTKLAPCPDGREGCCVAHFDKESFVCPKCGYDSGPDFVKAIREGRMVEEVGISIVNLDAISKLKFYME